MRIELRNKKGLFFEVDDEDSPRLYGISCTWSNSSGINVWINGKTVTIGRFILNVTDPNLIVDHINGNRFNNHKSNLRVCTKQQNTWNQGKRGSRTSSKYKWVHWNSGHKKWQAKITKNGVSNTIGYFDNEEDAARAADKVAKQFFGKFAPLNFKEEK